MSLQVWLPCTDGTLKNQGFNTNNSITSTAFSLNNNGKLGKCIKTSDTSYIDLLYNGNVINNKDISFGGWFKFNSSEIKTRLESLTSYTSTRTAATGNIIGNGSYGGIGLIWVSNTMYPNKVFSSISVLPYIRSTTLGHKNGTGYNIPLDTWVHIFLTLDKSNNKIYMYINGSLQQQLSISTFNDTVDRNMMINYSGTYGGNGPGTTIPFYCNDIRIYDELLSPFEIKRISQGLVVHYPFNDSYAESTTNLITTEDCLSNTCYNGSTSKYGYGTTTDMYKTTGIFQDKYCTKVYMGTSGNNCYPYVYINSMYTSDGTNSPAYKTLSFDYYTTISTSIRPYKLGSGSGTATYKVTNLTTSTGTGTDAVIIPVVPNMWNHIEITFHGTTAADSQWGYIQNSPAHVSDTSNYWLFANMQLETKDHATGYAGIGQTRTATVMYDCSGYKNNGIISGNLTVSSDCKRYSLSSYLPAAATISHANSLDNSNQEWTCCAWIKPTVITNYAQLNNFNLGNRIWHGTYPLLYINSGTNDYYNYGNQTVPINQWTHIAFVFKNSTGEKLIYINGENCTNTSGPNKTSTPSGLANTISIGGSNYDGLISDYREYATALSASDIMSLYKNQAFIATDGTFYTYEYEEG